ncbi:hypothetical protein [Marinobacter sp. HN1S83]|uniref:hypothetical protein n=1 Tax=Marinobacter sp. HN1S83 TaxID=3382301 RepID=UPI00387B07B4
MNVISRLVLWGALSVSPLFCSALERSVESNSAEDSNFSYFYSDREIAIVELGGSASICQWVYERLDKPNGFFDEKYNWLNVDYDLLKFPGEYYGKIKYLKVDIDGDMQPETVVKLNSYVGGELNWTDLLVMEDSYEFNYPVSVESIYKNTRFSLNRSGKDGFLDKVRNWEREGVDVVSYPDRLYGYLVYPISSNAAHLFEYNEQVYIFVRGRAEDENRRIGLVLRVVRSGSGEYNNRDICFFRK